MRANARDLIEDGITVFPIFNHMEHTTLFREAFQRAMSEFPEFQHTPEADELPFVMGGFGAFGNPASFHNGYIRTLRLVTAPTMRTLFRSVVEELDRNGNPLETEEGCGDWFFENLFDRMALRPAGSSITAESAHRDLNPQTVIPTGETIEVTHTRKDTTVTQRVPTFRPTPWDYCFGGWINLDSTGAQSFSCVPGSHKMPIIMTKGKTESGFDTHEPLHGKVQHFQVPPGHAVVFFQRIQHIVTPQRQAAHSYRQFRCYRLFRSTGGEAPLHGKDETARWMVDFATPRLPSNQRPPLYSSNHASFFLFKGDRNDPHYWSTAKIQPNLLEMRTAASGKHAGRTYRIAPRFLTSLRDYGMADVYPPYRAEEQRLMFPAPLTKANDTVTVRPEELDLESIATLSFLR